MFKIKFQTRQMLRGCKKKKKKLCTPGPRERNSELNKGLSQTYLWVSECLLQRHESAVTYHGDRGSGCIRPGWRSVRP